MSYRKPFKPMQWFVDGIDKVFDRRADAIEASAEIGGAEIEVDWDGRFSPTESDEGYRITAWTATAEARELSRA